MHVHFNATSPGYDEPLFDGEEVFTVRHASIGDVVTPEGRILASGVTLDQAAAELPGATFIVRTTGRPS